ncbi:MAG: PIN domain-containing protein [Saprospiraceae bacterium]|nr:PIN domain-containing protein [Saprospiraceae bacterium]
MNNKVFLDSSILIEYRKGTKTDLLDGLLDSRKCELYISQTVTSEYLYYLIAIFGGKSPLALKTSNEIAATLSKSKPGFFIEKFRWLQDDKRLFSSTVELMMQYNLLPNDAQILAICQLNQISAIASYDADFIKVCKDLNILLLQTLDDFEIFTKNIT